MRYFISCLVLAGFLWIGIGKIGKAQKAIVLFDEAKKISGSLGGVIEKIAIVNGERLYPGDTVSIHAGEIEFKVRVNYEDVSSSSDVLEIPDDIPSMKNIKLSDMKYDEEMIQIDHTVQGQRKKAFSNRPLRVYWKFIFVVRRPAAGAES